MEMVVGRWGTWEELVLGGAVVRYGTQAWDVVSSELRARIRTPNHPYIFFTPQVCKAKYEDLQQQYSGCTAWFEELRKKRVDQLKLELEKSEESIGSLESKLEVLKSQSRETSKDGLSAGSFTQEVKNINWQPIIQPKIKQQLQQQIIPKEVRGTPIRRRRGKRKRKDENIEFGDGFTSESANLGSSCIVVISTKYDEQEQPKIDSSEAKNIGIVHKKIRRRRKDSTKKPVEVVCEGHSENLSSTHYKEKPTSNHNREGDSIGIVGNTQLLAIFNNLATTPNALVFRHRLDSQKRARYRRIVRQHVDFDTIRTRISNRSITSVKELFRDLLLLANNALAFYSRRTREYKSALLLRDTVTKEYNKHNCNQDGPSNINIVTSSIFPLCNRPVKPRSLRPFQRKPTTKVPCFGDNVGLSTKLREKIKNNEEELVVFGNSEECRRPSSSTRGGRAGPAPSKIERKSSNAEEVLGPVIKLKRKTSSSQLPKTPTKGARRGRRR
ncbi:uncharacterized protein LOC124911967 [Impatiens glandulifera]|uniref:uncharacterized protein LOC124911967 n=1 Tax=Impatiens glandulifera TaxID=253017 RepID=UPI001FB04E54|nr:uncharacterized protein LOC124911967 [Impatiens glandulifera]